jgi:hypothetical protein
MGPEPQLEAFPDLELRRLGTGQGAIEDPEISRASEPKLIAQGLESASQTGAELRSTSDFETESWLIIDHFHLAPGPAQ